MTYDKRRIIVVDDNLENLTALKNTLKDIYEVYPSPSALKMFDLLEHIQPDLILLDVEMPGMNGYEAANKLKSNGKHRHIPVMFLTAMDDEESEMEGLRLGAVDYIHKPFVAPLLLQRIKTHLSLMEQQREIENLLELKTNEISLREAAENEARNASRAKSEFLSRMSHEIRSPLNAVIGMINIASNENDIQKIKSYLGKAGSAAKYMLGVINDILDMSKIEENKLELSYSEFSFEKMLANIIDITKIRGEEKHQHIDVNVNKNVPVFIVGDELRLSQVITNLLTNAIKFTPDNGKIALSAEKLDESEGGITLRVEVADSGIGISEEQQKRLFTSYNQADSSIAQKFGGTGLGLAISKRIVELMQGKIWIESELNKGAKFIFTVKAQRGTDLSETDKSETDKSGKVSSAESSENSFDFRGCAILVAEDMEFNREILAKYLEKTGISIDFAENGKKAVSMFTDSPDKYNLILMDVHMPEMDGYEATRTIRALELTRAKTITIIAMTADVFREDIEKCLAAGMNDHIAKPIAPKDMYVKLKNYLVIGNI
jgi:signal transduction histidine kinase